MSIIDQGSSPFEPYARLINIIGDQLITDKKVAVIEIIKNSYDADAEKSTIRFSNLDNFKKFNLTEPEEPCIEIEDDGEGMPLQTIKEIWLRPATPNKLDKKNKKQTFTKKGRIIQGEKGIGRFAIHKLGEKIEIYTKTLTSPEVKLSLDFSDFNPENNDLFNQTVSDYKLLSEVQNKWTVSDTPEKIKQPQGTLIRISKLREAWNKSDFEELSKAISRLTPPNDPNSKSFEIKIAQDFNTKIYINNTEYTSPNLIKFDDVIERAPFQIKGTISKEANLTFSYKAIKTNREIKQKINLLDENELATLNYDSWAIKTRFTNLQRTPLCGEIHFSLYAYDLSNIEKTSDTKELKSFIKDNFVYLFRDGVRVYPFGEQGYDWLNLDKLRSVVKAGKFPSYNDLIGFVYIGQLENPLLRDSTNRQGIVNNSGAYDDFRYLVTAVTEIFNIETKIDKEKVKLVKSNAFKQYNDVLLKSYNVLKSNLERIDDKETLEKANSFLDTVNKHTELLRERMVTVEDLAGLGMAVEKASHDTFMLLSQMRINVQQFQTKVNQDVYSNKEASDFLSILDENLSIIYEEMQVIQPLFKFQRKTIQDVSIFESINKVIKYYRREIENKIEIKIIQDDDIIISTNKGLILQFLINLLDNAIYWVNKGSSAQKEIIFQINSKDRTLTIGDNGPGIRNDIAPLIFNEFFSLKSDGRGLGLYIVKEILMRISADINLVESEKNKFLSGANFIINFNNEL